MHCACLVVGPLPDAQLEPFSDTAETPRRKVYYTDEDVALMAQHFSLSVTDLPALAARMPEWESSEGGVEDGRIFRWSTENPNGKYDWYEQGGRFGDFLWLREPVAPPAWRRLLGAKPKQRVSQARKMDIKEEPLLADPPAAFLRNGEWSECPMGTDAAALAEWNVTFAALFASVPADALLTIIDLHS